MNLALCVLSMALMGADDQTLTQVANPNSPHAINSKPKPEGPAGPVEKQIWRLTLSDAIKIALDNGEIVRVIPQRETTGPTGAGFTPATAPGARPMLVPVDLLEGMKPDPSSLVIVRLNADAGLERFRSEVMAAVRSVVELYWNLAEMDAAVWAAEQSVNLARDVVDLEQALLSPDKELTGLADAALKLEQFQELLTERRQSAEKSERHLRNALALPPHDNRQIIASDHPVKEHVVFDWETCLDALKHKQPDVRQQKAIVAQAERILAEARKAIVEAANKRGIRQDPEVKRTFLGFSVPLRQPLANTRQAQYAVLRSQTYLDEVVQQTTQSLARAINNAESSYRRYAEARRMRDADDEHLKAQRVDWNEGRITAGRFLEAVEKYSTLVTNEHHQLAAYNLALTFVSECKGTLLEDRSIIVCEVHRSPVATSAGAPKK
jgi:hypothetical protein